MKLIDSLKRKVEIYTDEIFLPGFEGLSLWQLIKIFFEGFAKGSVTTRASAISFKVILALAPTVILLFTLIPFIPIDNFQEDLITGIKQVLPPAVFDFVESNILSLINNKYGTFLSISFALGVYYASNSAHALLQGLKESYYLENKQPGWKQRLYSVILLLVLPIFLGTAFLIQTLASSLLNELLQIGILESFEKYIFFAAKWIIILLLMLLAVSTLYNLAIENRKRWKIISPGTLFSTFLIVIASEAFSYYVTHFGQFNKFYGSLGTVVILLLWIYYINVILILGFDVNMTLKTAKYHGKQKTLIP